jgi:histidinol phosphatase-like enzyme
MKTYIFDIDGTICTNSNGKYHDADPITTRIKIINDLYEAGNIIILHTARGMGSSENNSKVASEKWHSFTVSQLSNWGVKYHQIFFGKPAGDFYIDDKGQNDIDFFTNYPKIGC